MIQHQERLAKEKAAKRAAKAATPKQKKEAKTAIEKMLAELPDELRASIIANFAKN